MLTILFALLFIKVYSEYTQLESHCIKNDFKYYPNSVHKDAAKLLRKENFRMNIFGHWDYHRSLYRIYFVNGTKPRQQFVLCVPPKSGTTQTFIMLQKIFNESFTGVVNDYSLQPNTHHALTIQNLEFSKLEKILYDPQIPRIMIVRDPYSRIVSAYKDKINDPKKTFYNKNLGFKFQNVTFKQFVSRLFNKRVQHRLTGVLGHGNLDMHFLSQYYIGMFHLGMQYNYILKLEEINDWFSCLIDKVNIREEMMHGWPEEDQCYLSTPHAPCNGPVILNGVLSGDVKSFAEHNHNTLLESDKYFNDPKVLQMVTQMYQQDLIFFGYQFRRPVPQKQKPKNNSNNNNNNINNNNSNFTTENNNKIENNNINSNFTSDES